MDIAQTLQTILIYALPVLFSITIHEAAAAPGSLWIILFGVAITLPVIVGYSTYTYGVFRGKARPLAYE